MLKRVKIVDTVLTVLVILFFIGTMIYLTNSLKTLPKSIYVHFDDVGQFDVHGTHEQGKYGIRIGLLGIFFSCVASILTYLPSHIKKITDKGNERLQCIFILFSLLHKLAIMLFASFWNISIATQEAIIRKPTLVIIAFVGIGWILFMGSFVGIYKTHKVVNND